MSSAGAMAAASAQAAIINAIRSFGVIVTVAPQEFLDIVQKQDAPLVVTSTSGIFVTEYRYLVSYKGLTFFTKSASELDLPLGVELVKAQNLSLPM